jgi:acetyl/propionyl-CoA carboxylase alpha subunit
MQIRSLLIANRGEIACRIIRTCKRLGIETVAIYSEPDRTSLHVRSADRAIALGGAESKDSYLKIDAVVEAACRAGVDAVHPGYGFLSENPLFADALAAKGIKLVGPAGATMRALGDKIRAKELAARCNVPTVPSLILDESVTGEAAVAAQVAAFGEQVGYPILIKASAGGGGRGMRRIDGASEIPVALESAAREAQAFFGDRRVFVEKLVLRPRHVEVQLLGDSHGDVTHFFDRDCTMQRRHQKVIEEAPAALLDPAVRSKILASAVALAKEARYENAGTAEFLVDRSGNFFFLEVNSRLQVEHPVTEEHTGVDLVELQIRVAEGTRLSDILPARPPTPRQNASIEVRVCAEDPDHGFAPSIGQIAAFTVPELPGIRVETGIDSLSSISHYYDPMVAKVIATAPTRAEAAELLVKALKGAKVLGVTTNIPYLITLLQSAAFRAMEHDTKTAELIAAEGGGSLTARLERAAVCTAAARAAGALPGDPWAEHCGFRLSGFRFPRQENVRIANSSFGYEVQQSISGCYAVRLTSGTEPEGCYTLKAYSLEHTPNLVEGALFELTQKGFEGGSETLLVQHTVCGKREWITVEGESFEVVTPRHGRRGEASSGSSGLLASPLPGKVLEIKVKEGATVEAGSVIVVLESMKMEHTVTAPFKGIIKSISATVGAIVDASAPLASMEPVE